MSQSNQSGTAKRSAGILLHPTSLPGPFGIGDLGPTAYAWVDALSAARQTWWQILPLGPTGFGDSPYSALSAFAGNPNLISLEVLVQEGLLGKDDVSAPDFPADHVQYVRAAAFKDGALARAFENFRRGGSQWLRQPFDEYCHREARWLEDFSLFMALKEKHGGGDWHTWPQPLVMREDNALHQARLELGDRMYWHKFRQYLFARQWGYLKSYANQRKVRIVGDVPIFVAGDSVDVWANLDIFQLNEQRNPRVVAGVPPDYFSSTGQLWGNPLYDWEALRRTGYRWWLDRLRQALQQVDLIRLDHFRGFEAYWQVPAGMPTAEHGQWIKAPGADFFATVRRELGHLPLIAEDLGIITDEVEALRRQFELPGMCILQFAFLGGGCSKYQPHSYERNTVAYTGTHDNDTTRGWFAALTPLDIALVKRYVPAGPHGVVWDFIRLAWASVANYAITPLQDVLNLGTEARMNMPGNALGNWRWRALPGAFNKELIDRLRDITEVYERCP